MKDFHSCKSSSDLTLLRVLKRVVHGFVIFYLKMCDLILYKSECCCMRRSTSPRGAPTLLSCLSWTSDHPGLTTGVQIRPQEAESGQRRNLQSDELGLLNKVQAGLPLIQILLGGQPTHQDEKYSQVGHALPETALGNVEKDGLVTAATVN